MKTLLERVDRWVRPAMPKERVALLRLLIGIYAFFHLLGRLPHLLRFASYDARFFDPVGILGWMEGPLPAGLYLTSVALTVCLALPFAAGLFHRWLAPAYALGLWIVLTYTNSFGKLLHTENMLVLHVTILAFAPAADAHALGPPRRGAPSGAEAKGSRDHGWPVRTLCAVTVLAYLIAGVAKVDASGLAFLSGENLRNYVAFDNVRKLELGSFYSPLGAALVPHPGLFTAFAWASLVLELAAPLALFHSRLGRGWAIAVWGFHLGVLLLMAIAFPYQLTFIAFLPFFDVERWRWPKGLAHRLGLRSPSAHADAGVDPAEGGAVGEAR